MHPLQEMQMAPLGALEQVFSPHATILSQQPVCDLALAVLARCLEGPVPSRLPMPRQHIVVFGPSQNVDMASCKVNLSGTTSHECICKFHVSCDVSRHDYIWKQALKERAVSRQFTDDILQQGNKGGNSI